MTCPPPSLGRAWRTRVIGKVSLRAALIGLVCAANLSPLHAACRQALALGLDVSGSVDATEYRLQLDGIVGALADPRVQDLLFAMPSAPVRIAIYEWSNPEFQRLLVDWIQINTASDVARLTNRLSNAVREAANPATGLGTAMTFGADLLAQQPACWKRTLDISGDGKSNSGPRPSEVGQLPTLQMVTINGLVVGSDTRNVTDTRAVQIGELQAYYAAEVIQGPNAFVETALGFEQFQDAMTRKLLRELEGITVSHLRPWDHEEQSVYQ